MLNGAQLNRPQSSYFSRIMTTPKLATVFSRFKIRDLFELMLSFLNYIWISVLEDLSYARPFGSQIATIYKQRIHHDSNISTSLRAESKLIQVIKTCFER